MRIPKALMDIIARDNYGDLLEYKHKYLQTNTLADWHKLYDSAIAAKNSKAKVFCDWSDKCYVSEIDPHHNED